MLLNINSGSIGFLILREKMTSSTCLERSGLKLIFHWKAQIISKSLFNAFADVFLSWTTEKRKVSFVKNLGFDDKLVDKSLM